MVYVSHKGKTWGAYDTATLQRHVDDRKFFPTDLANVVGSDNWQPVNTIASFSAEAQQIHVHHKEKKKTGGVTWVILVGFIGIILVVIFGGSDESSREPDVASKPTITDSVSPKIDSASPKIDSTAPIINFTAYYDSPPNLDDPIIRKKVLAETTKEGKLGSLGIEGHGLIYYPNGNTPYTGWLATKTHYGGVWILQCKDGKRDGLSSSWNQVWQKRIESHWKEGRQHGAYTTWFENGRKSYECYYVEGKRQGMAKSWRRDGSRHYEVNYKDDKKHGVYTLWDENGRVKNQFRFENGNVVD